MTLATFHLHEILQEFLGQDCPVFNLTYDIFVCAKMQWDQDLPDTEHSVMMKGGEAKKRGRMGRGPEVSSNPSTVISNMKCERTQLEYSL